MGTFFNGTVGGLKVWHFALLAVAAVVVGCVVHSMISTQNMVTSSNNGSFLRVSYFGPLSAEKKAEIGANFDKSAAEAAAKKAA